MALGLTSVDPATLSAATGGNVSVAGAFPSGEQPFRVYISGETIDMYAELEASAASGDEETFETTVPGGLPPGPYEFWVEEVGNGANNAFLAMGALTLTGEDEEAIDPSADSLDPGEFTIEGGELTVTGTWDPAVEYTATLAGPGDDVALGVATSEDGVTLVFTVPADLAPGDYEVTVTWLVDFVATSVNLNDDDAPVLSVTVLTEGGFEAPVTAQARETADVLEQVRRWLPAEYCGADPLLAGLSAVMAASETCTDDLREQATVELASDRWLTLAARGQGILRASGEDDASLRIRIRSTDDQVTRPALQGILDTLLGEGAATILEWWDHGYLNVESPVAAGLWLNNRRLSGGRSGFLVIVPAEGWIAFGSYLNVPTSAGLWLNGPRSALGRIPGSRFFAILNAIRRARAAGIYWRLCLES